MPNPALQGTRRAPRAPRRLKSGRNVARLPQLSAMQMGEDQSIFI